MIRCLVLLALTSIPRGGDNLLANPGAEEGGKAPKGWEKGNPVPGVEYLWEKEAGEGKRSLSLKKTVERFFPIAEWNQELAHDGSARKLHFGALVKAEAARKALLDVQFLDSADKWTHAWAAYIGPHGEDETPATHDWLWYSGVVAVPAGTKRLEFGLQIYGPGQVWFDRLFAAWVDDATPASDPLALAPQPASAWGALPLSAPTTEKAGKKGKDEPGEEAAAPPIAIGGDAQQRFFRIEPRGPAAAKGRGLLIVLPGGDGSADFRSFVGEIAARAAPADYVVAQAIAHEWKGAEDLVWPTRADHASGVKTPAEDLVQAIVGEVRKTEKLDPRRIFLLGWSSGGPPCYATCLDEKSPVRGALVAMSVFKPAGSLDGADGRAFYVLHSPEDFIAMSFPESAVRDLARNGAKTKLTTYAGGHGWHGDVYGMISEGLRWLEENAGK